MYCSNGFRLMASLVLTLLAGKVHSQPSPLRRPPHIVFIIADDMGWNDVSFHGSDQIQTPNIDSMAYQSIILQKYYSEPICTPARTALLTGKYPFRLGMQGYPLYNSEDRGIPLSERLLPAYLKDLGYTTHLVGKWHLGMSRNEYLPLRRGFDSHYGMRGGFIDYYTYNKVEEWPNGRIMCGLDLFNDMELMEDREEYLTDMLTDRAIQLIRDHNSSTPLYLQLAHGAPHAGNPGALLQPPPIVSLQNRHIAYSDRRLYADVVTNLDQNIGRVVRALADTGILQDTLIVFMSDNGAPTVGQFNNWGINLPFRGIKQTPWEGAMRVPAFIWHSSFQPRIWNGLMHITDWLPTLLAAAGGELDRVIDGVNQWNAITSNGLSQRNEVVSIDDTSNFASYRSGDYKIVVGNVSNLNNGYYREQWMSVKSSPPQYLPALRSCEVTRVLESQGYTLNLDTVATMREGATIRQLDTVRDAQLCEPSPTRGCLFNLRRDPLEAHNLWGRFPTLATALTQRLRALWFQRRPRTLPVLLDGRAEPAARGYNWLPWLPDGAPDSSAPPISRSSRYLATEANLNPPSPSFSSDNSSLTTPVTESTFSPINTGTVQTTLAPQFVQSTPPVSTTSSNLQPAPTSQYVTPPRVSMSLSNVSTTLDPTGCRSIGPMNFLCNTSMTPLK